MAKTDKPRPEQAAPVETMYWSCPTCGESCPSGTFKAHSEACMRTATRKQRVHELVLALIRSPWAAGPQNPGITQESATVIVSTALAINAELESQLG